MVVVDNNKIKMERLVYMLYMYMYMYTLLKNTHKLKKIPCIAQITIKMLYKWFLKVANIADSFLIHKNQFNMAPTGTW